MGERSAAQRRLARWLPLAVALVVISMVAAAAAQQRQGAERRRGANQGDRVRPPGLPRVALRDEPLIINTHEIEQVRVVVVTRGLSHPWGLAFLPGGDMLVTERGGTLRMIRDGVLDPEPIDGVPEVLARGLSGLMDVALHPQFAQNRLVYLSYTRPIGERAATVALIRGRLDGMALRDVEDIFVATPWGGSTASARIGFAPDGLLYMTLGGLSARIQTVRMPRTRTAMPESCCGCGTTAAYPTTTRSSAVRATSRRSSRWGIATNRG